MANQITDNRTILFDGDSVTGDNGGRWDTLGSTSETLDTDVKIEGTGSIAEQFSNSRRTLIWDNGSTIDLSNTHLYIWVNCGVVGLLDTKANGGFTIRLTGPSNANFVEWYVGGSDSWPTSVEGGWTMFVVDTAAATSNTGGTPPALTAIQGIGISGVTASVMTKVADNTWIDAGWSLAANTPGIIIEGRNGGSTDWNSADILTQLGLASGMFVPSAGGSYKLNAPIQFGINDTTTHGFADTNVIWLWDDQEFVATDHYSLSALGNSGGTTNVTFGVKTGTGDDATGSQGVVISAASTGVRWSMDFNDPDLDLIAFYGSSFVHGSDFLLDDVAVSVISSLYIDCTSATVDNSEQLRISVINANTADDVAFMFTDDIGDVVFSSFEFSDGHGLEITSGGPASQTSKGNLWANYLGTVGSNLVAGPSGSTDAAVQNNAGAARTIDVTDGGQNFSVRNVGASDTTTVNLSVAIDYTFIDDLTEAPIQGVRVVLGESPSVTDIIAFAESDASGDVSATFSGATPATLAGYASKGSEEPVYRRIALGGTLGADGLAQTIRMQPD